MLQALVGTVASIDYIFHPLLFPGKDVCGNREGVQGEDGIL
jgi:hypothetical protein